VCGSWQVHGQVYPIPIRGGDIIPPFDTQFFPGPGVGLDGLNAEPHGITNFSGIVAMAYISGADTMAVTRVTFPASVGVADDDATLTLTGTYTGGTFSSSLEIAIAEYPGEDH
jgi:hypothetical protein